MECKLDHLDVWAGERTARWCGKGMIFKRFKDICSIRTWRIRKKSIKYIDRRYLQHWRIRNNFADDKCMPMLNIQKSPGGKSIECTNKLCLSIAWRKCWCIMKLFHQKENRRCRQVPEIVVTRCRSSELALHKTKSIISEQAPWKFSMLQLKTVKCLSWQRYKTNRTGKSNHGVCYPLVAIRLLRPFHLTLQAADVSSSESSLVTDTIKFEESNRI